ncbi:MAG TPA: PIN domain-containing protein [Rhodothermales bacterium]|nr:PIN domain-containing protein [Rhodothermales bacterium]
MEAEAILSVLDLVKDGRIELVSSDALVFEIGRNPHLTRQEFAQETIAEAPSHVELSKTVERRAQALNKTGIATLDSLHLASAEAGDADFFCTCDDSFLKKAKREVSGRTQIVSPLELAEEIGKWDSRQGR